MKRSDPHPDPFPSDRLPDPPQRGRGAAGKPDGRFEAWSREGADDGWGTAAEPAPVTTTFMVDTSRSVISRNDSPDIPFDQSVNPYRGCEHGCPYCYARPTHAYLGLSPGLDFETRIAYKPEAARQLRDELARPGYRCSPITLGANTDPYQPVERRLGITREILEVLSETRHPVTVVTKSALVERDADLLADLARDGLAEVLLSVTTLDEDLARWLEPRAGRPRRRLAAMRALADAGVPTGVLFAPLIPGLNDHEMEAVLAAAREAGAQDAGWVLLRLPLEVEALFRDWLERHEPGRAGRVFSLLRQMRGGRANDPRFGHRMRGEGPLAEIHRRRFELACARLGLNRTRRSLDCSRFTPPAVSGRQLGLF